MHAMTNGKECPSLINQQGNDVSPHLSKLIDASLIYAYSGLPYLDHLDYLQKNRGGTIEIHPALHPFVEDPNILERVDEVDAMLKSLGTTAIQITSEVVQYDGQRTPLSFVTATAATAAEGKNNMTEQVWIRDQAFVAWGLLEQGFMSGDSALRHQGQNLLKSLLHAMSSPSQLERFDHVIFENGKVAPHEHPVIKFNVRHDDEGITLESDADWGHNQDAWQILASLGFSALEQGWIEQTDIQKYGEFFKRIPKFLHKTNYLERASKGSWEEISAKGRLSTIAWEWSLLPRLQKYSDIFGFDLETKQQMDEMIQAGAQAIITRFPHES